MNKQLHIVNSSHKLKALICMYPPMFCVKQQSLQIKALELKTPGDRRYNTKEIHIYG